MKTRRTKTYNRQATHSKVRKEIFMADKIAERMPKEKIQELKEMIQQKPKDEPVEKVLVNFCERHAVTLGTCRKYYERLVENGDIKEE